MRYKNEILNLRSFYLRLIGKIWLLPAAVIIGATAGFIIYFLTNVVWGPAREYTSRSKLYLNFAVDEKGDVYNYYNGYTWNELMTTDDILNGIMDHLKSEGVQELAEGSQTRGSMKGITRKEVSDSVTAAIPSDIRLLVITVTHSDPELVTAILKACDSSLLRYGEKRDAFSSIELLQEDDSAELIIYTDRTLTAVITGAVLAVLILICLGLLMQAMDDAAYVPEDLEKRYNVPVLGVLPRRGMELTARFDNELKDSFRQMAGKRKNVALVCASASESLTDAKKVLDQLKDIIKAGSDFDSTVIIPLPLPGEDPEAFRQTDNCDGAILAVEAGKHSGALAEHTLSQLSRHECPVLGMILTGTDIRFLRRYYGIKK
jgi:capsular polysaccharide biosynthesis protein